jgi:disulfide bond formation protein DsbB
MPSFAQPARSAALLILVVAAAAIGGALVFEHGFGYVPCKLCLQQRLPYYAALPIALATVAAPGRGPWLRLGLAVLALLFLISAGLGIYHSGVEWGLWLGPSDCGGGGGAGAGNVADLMKSLNNIHVVSCTEAAWRFLGLSLAGWNALISLALAAIAGWGLTRHLSGSPGHLG